ncbi:MAG: hypothetical protein MHMPM18_003080, partial [Marteilia pararefringens]
VETYHSGIFRIETDEEPKVQRGAPSIYCKVYNFVVKLPRYLSTVTESPKTFHPQNSNDSWHCLKLIHAFMHCSLT